MVCFQRYHFQATMLNTHQICFPIYNLLYLFEHLANSTKIIVLIERNACSSNTSIIGCLSASKKSSNMKIHHILIMHPDKVYPLLHSFFGISRHFKNPGNLFMKPFLPKPHAFTSPGLPSLAPPVAYLFGLAPADRLQGMAVIPSAVPAFYLAGKSCRILRSFDAFALYSAVQQSLCPVLGQSFRIILPSFM